MTTRITGREWEDLSAYLDGQLSPKESARLDEKLQASADLRAALNELSQTRSLLRSQPAVRAPRNFLLTPKMVGVSRAPARTFQLFPVMRLASVLAMALFVLVLAGDLLMSGGQPAVMPVAFQSAQMPAPAAELKSAPEAGAPEVGAVMEAPAATEAPAEAKMPEGAVPLPAPTMAAAMLQDNGTGAEAYPPPAEGLAASAPAVEQSTATPPASEPTPSAPEQANLAERSAVDSTEVTAPAQQTVWSGWRTLEIALALLVVVTAGWAFYLRRSRRV
jgi:anti-sigma factor RsiW